MVDEIAQIVNIVQQVLSTYSNNRNSELAAPSFSVKIDSTNSNALTKDIIFNVTIRATSATNRTTAIDTLLKLFSDHPDGYNKYEAFYQTATLTPQTQIATYAYDSENLNWVKINQTTLWAVMDLMEAGVEIPYKIIALVEPSYSTIRLTPESSMVLRANIYPSSINSLADSISVASLLAARVGTSTDIEFTNPLTLTEDEPYDFDFTADDAQHAIELDFQDVRFGQQTQLLEFSKSDIIIANTAVYGAYPYYLETKYLKHDEDYINEFVATVQILARWSNV